MSEKKETTSKIEVERRSISSEVKFWLSMDNTHLPSCFAIHMSRSVVARLNNQIRVLDEATRHRRRQRQLDNLEKDNFQEDPHASFAHLIGKHKLPTFSDSNEGSLLFSARESEGASMYLVYHIVVCFCYRQGYEET